MKKLETTTDGNHIVEIERSNIDVLFDQKTYIKFDRVMLVTHPGVFHGDDVAATAIWRIALSIWQPTATIDVFRTTETCWDVLVRRGTNYRVDVPEMIAVIQYDIGGKDFDHHGTTDEFHPTTVGTDCEVKYAAFGKIWRAIGKVLLWDTSADAFERQLVIPFDAQDTGAYGNPLSLLISQFNPNWDDSQDAEYRNDQFNEVVDLVQRMFVQWFNREESTHKAEDMVRRFVAQSDDPKVLLMPTYVPTGRLLVDEFPEVLLTVSPSIRDAGVWNLNCVRKNPDEFGNKINLPKRWLENPPEGCTFCHKERFIAAFETQTDALNAAQLAIKEAYKVVDLRDAKKYDDYVELI